MQDFSAWVKSVGGGYRAAEILGTNQPQVQRWKKAGAFIAPGGRIFIEVSASYTPVGASFQKIDDDTPP